MASHKGKRIKEQFPLFLVTFEWFQGLAETMLCHCVMWCHLIPCSMTFPVNHLLDGYLIRARVACSTRYNPTAKCKTIRKAYTSAIDFTENGVGHLFSLLFLCPSQLRKEP